MEIQLDSSVTITLPSGTSVFIGNSDGGIQISPGDVVDITGAFPLKLSQIQFDPVLVEFLPPSPTFGMIMAVSDSDTDVWGEIIGGEGDKQVLVMFNGQWRVFAK